MKMVQSDDTANGTTTGITQASADAAPKRRITFEVDPLVLFDTLAQMKGNFAPLGERLVGALLAKPGFADQLGMGIYGVVLVSDEPAAAER
jgi:hypothetical protein